MKKEWLSNDAWWLQALYLSDGSIRSIISCGDYINHAVFTYEEFDAAASSLSAAGIVNNSGTVFQMDKKFKQEYEKGKPGRNPLKEVDKMLVLLQKKIGPPSFYSSVVEKKTFQEALEHYLRSL